MMNRLRRHRSALLGLLVGFVGIGCGEPQTDAASISVADRESALALEAIWAAREPEAYAIWSKVDEGTIEGRRIRRLLRLADAHYREGIAQLKKGESGAAGMAFDRGAAIAPINPEHYFALAAYFENRRLNETAAKYYMKFARAAPPSDRTDAARAMARRLDPTVERAFDAPVPGGANREGRPLSSLVLILIAGVFLGGALALAVMFVIWPVFGRGVALDTLIDQAPELHSAIAYLIGSLRHELLKHRIGVVADVLENMKTTLPTGPQQQFLSKRLFGGVPVDEAWHAHMTAFERALGSRLNLQRDRRFRRARKAIRTIAKSEAVYGEKGAGALRALRRAHLELKRFDRYLAAEQERLVRTRVDTSLLEQVADEVRGEYAVSTLSVSNIRIAPVSHPVHIEVPRVDLLIILKNLFRNAMLAVADTPAPRRVSMSVRIELEPTGEESVRIMVDDSSRVSLSPQQITETSVGSGLDLVTTAVRRYGGSIDVAQRNEGKSVQVRFFRAFEDNGAMP